MQDIKVFLPDDNATVGHTVTTSSSRVQLRAAATGEQSDTVQVRVYNTGSVAVFVRFGNSSVTATVPVVGGAAGGVAIAPGSVEPFGIRSSDTHVAAITSSGSATVYWTLGEGV